MKKFLSVLLLALVLVLVTGCTKPEVKEEPRTYMADGTYMAWKFTSSSSNLLLPDGTVAKDANDANIKVNTPALVTVKVLIHNDEIVKYEIDELQSKPYVSVPRNSTIPNYNPETGAVTGVTWKWNDMTKKELEYGYNMENQAPKGEWYIQALALENHWLTNGAITDESTPLTSVTIHFNDYAEVARAAVKNAKDGKVAAITDKEHYTYDVTYVTGDINAEGKISNIKIDAHMFGGTNDNTYTVGHADYLKFSWNAETKYDSYGPMKDGKLWQDQIDALVTYINTNGWDGSLTSGNGTDATKGITNFGQEVEALTTVTMQVYREVYVMNMLLKFFPRAWK